MAMKSPTVVFQTFNGRDIDYDHVYGTQCVDGAKAIFAFLGIPVVACPNNYAESYWTCETKSGKIDPQTKAWQAENFVLIYDKSQFRDGDFVIWPYGSHSHPQSHIAMYYHGQEFGERQYENNRAFCLKATDFSDAFGALRWKEWQTTPVLYGMSRMTCGSRTYSLWRMTGRDKIAVLSPGINKVAKIQDIDHPDILAEARVTGANLFQMEDDQADPYGTTYGDLSDPLHGILQSLPNQNSTLYYDLDTGMFGDCTGIQIDPTHSVFSPTLVFPNSRGHWEYATAFGLDRKDRKSWYTFIVRFQDGYAVGLANQETTPQEIVADFSQTDMVNIAFMDGGGSAQAAFWYSGKMNYERYTGRAVASAIVIYVQPEKAKKSVTRSIGDSADQENPEEQQVGVLDLVEAEPKEFILPEENYGIEEEDEEMEEEKEEKEVTIMEQIAKLIDVKSIMTFMLIFTLCYMQISGKEPSQAFITAVTSVVTFYFTHQINKKGEQQK